MTEKELRPKCETCGGTGAVTRVVGACCGNVLPTGECCAAMYGTANLIPTQEQEACDDCGGAGVRNAP